MSKTLLYRLFNIGSLPKEAALQIEREGAVLLEEGIGGSVTFRRFRAPGKRYGLRRTWFSGSIALTQEHFLAFQYAKPIIGVAWRDAKIKELQCSLEDAQTLCVKFDASAFNDDWSGEIEVRFSTPRARTFLEIIERKMAGE